MDGLSLVLLGVVAGLVVAIGLIGRAQVVIQHSGRDQYERGNGCAAIPLLLILAMLAMLLLGSVKPAAQSLTAVMIGG